MGLQMVFNCCIVGGFVIPVMNVVAGAVGGALHLGADVDLDADVDLNLDMDLDADIDVDIDADVDVDLDTDLDLDADLGADAAGQGPGLFKTLYGKLPINLMSLSLTAVVFGAVGRLLLGKLHPALCVILSLQLGVLAGVLLSLFVIKPLKQNRAYAANVRALRGRIAEVKLEVRSDFTGTIRTVSATGSLVTYDARPVEGVARIPAGQKVRIVDVEPEKELCFVRPLESEIEI